MAEGYLRHFVEAAGRDAEVFSAGIEAHGLNHIAVQVMQEDGVDISRHESETIEDLPDVEFAYVITVCDNANEHCPYYPGTTTRIHHSFRDPASATGSEEEVLGVFREVRNEIKAYAEQFIGELP